MIWERLIERCYASDKGICSIRLKIESIYPPSVWLLSPLSFYTWINLQGDKFCWKTVLNGGIFELLVVYSLKPLYAFTGNIAFMK